MLEGVVKAGQFSCVNGQTEALIQSKHKKCLQSLFGKYFTQKYSSSHPSHTFLRDRMKEMSSNVKFP
jgi:hypothetical protein